MCMLEQNLYETLFSMTKASLKLPHWKLILAFKLNPLLGRYYFHLGKTLTSQTASGIPSSDWWFPFALLRGRTWEGEGHWRPGDDHRHGDDTSRRCHSNDRQRQSLQKSAFLIFNLGNTSCRVHVHIIPANSPYDQMELSVFRPIFFT